MACRAPAVGQSICNIFQILTATDTGAFLAEISLQPVIIEGESAVVLGLSTPTDMLLTIRPGYKTEAQSETLPLDWRTCSPEVCLASRVLQPSEVEALQAGQQMIMGYQSAKQATPLRFSVSLKGVTRGLSSMVQ
ncbi:MAG: invasion associated locus B family protein [Rhodobacteraceae bacterium]|nr:invasion associated locus B family protein [Paracoccaceae bacterium]